MLKEIKIENSVIAIKFHNHVSKKDIKLHSIFYYRYFRINMFSFYNHRQLLQILRSNKQKISFGNSNAQIEVLYKCRSQDFF